MMLNPARTIRAFWPCFHEVVHDCDSALEIGCGDGNILRQAAKHNMDTLTGIEVYEPYVDPQHPANRGINFIFSDALQALPLIADDSYDLVLLIDIVEHFEKQDGWRALNHADRIARKLILLWIPEGLDVQDKEHFSSEQYTYQPHQDHLSQWYRDELADFGFNVAVWENYHWDRRTGDKENKTIPAMFCVKQQDSEQESAALADRAHDDAGRTLRGDGAEGIAATGGKGARR